MSRIGLRPIKIPEGVTVSLDKNIIEVRGPKGSLRQKLLAGFSLNIKGDTLTVTKLDQTPEAGKYYGLLRTLVNNMIIGVTEGFTRELEIKGVGFRAQMEGANLVLSLGFSHKIMVEPPAGIELAVASNTHLTISGHDKQLVGQVAARIRQYKKPEPYKGKGIKYSDEVIRRKAGKTVAKAV